MDYLRISNGIASRLNRLKTRWVVGRLFASLGRGTSIERPGMLAGTHRISIGEDTCIRYGARIETVAREGEPPGLIRIGKRVSVEQNLHLVACGVIDIADDVCIAANVSIIDTAHPIGNGISDNRVKHLEGGPAWVRIGKRAFIGTGATILRNVTIGDNAVVGAGAVVTRDIRANAIVAGVPAREIGEVPER